MAPRAASGALVAAALATLAAAGTPGVMQLRLSRRSLLVEDRGVNDSERGSGLTWARERALRAAALASDADTQHRLRRRLQAAVAIYGDYRELAYYYADVFVGSPAPQRFSVITDTGSSIMSVPCKGCSTCGRHQNPPYDPGASASAAKLTCSEAAAAGGTLCSSCASDGGCEYVQSYAEGSALRGVIYRDLVFLGDDSDVVAAHAGGDAGGAARRLTAASIYSRGRRAQGAAATAADEPNATPAANASTSTPPPPPPPPPREPHSSLAVPFEVGCGRYESGLFVSQLADGILGIGPSDRTLFAALWRQGALRRRMFSLCLAWVGGALTVGDVDTSLHTGPVQWAALTVSGYYGVGLTGLAVGDPGPGALSGGGGDASIEIDVSSFSASGGGAGRTTIVDSGTTFTYLPRAVYRPFLAALAAWCERPGRCVGRKVPVTGEDLCYRIARPADLATFPSVTVRLAPANPLLDPPVTLTVPPQSVFVSMGWHRGAFCLAYHNNGVGRDVGAVLGANTLLGHDVIVDRTERLVGPQRVGFAAAHCSVDGSSGTGGDGTGGDTDAGAGGVWAWWVDWWGGEDADTVVAGVPDATVAAGAVVGALLATCLVCACASYCCGCRCCACCRRADGEWVCRLGKVVSISIAPASSTSAAASSASPSQRGSSRIAAGGRGGSSRPVIVPKVRLFDATHRPRPDLARVIAGASAPRLASAVAAAAAAGATSSAAAVAAAPAAAAQHADYGTADDERDDEGAALTGAPAVAVAAADADGSNSGVQHATSPATAVRIELPHPADAMAALRRGAAAAAAGVAGAGGRRGRRYQQLQRAGSSDASEGGGDDSAAAAEGVELVAPAGASDGAAQPHR
jgi:hypothetical protein